MEVTSIFVRLMTVLITDSKSNLKYLLSIIINKGSNYGLNLNMNKTKFMRINKNNTRDISLTTNEGNIEQIESYCYLGTYNNTR